MISINVIGKNTHETQMYVKILQDRKDEEIPRLFYLSVFASNRK